MYPADMKYVDEITKLSAEKRKQLFGYFQRLEEPVRLFVMKLQTDLMRQYRAQYYNKDKQAEFAYGMLILAIAKVREPEQRLHKKSGSPLSDKVVEEIRSFRIERLKLRKPKPSVVREEIERLYHVIAGLREENLSWIKISEYLKKYHHVTVSHSYIERNFKLSQKRREMLDNLTSSE